MQLCCSLVLKGGYSLLSAEIEAVQPSQDAQNK